jgi:Tol biopolymer transport system component
MSYKQGALFVYTFGTVILLPCSINAATQPTTTMVSVSSQGYPGNSDSGLYQWSLGISGDGRYVAFVSAASNLVANDTNSHHDIFVHDRQTGQTTRVSVNSSGAQSNGDSDFPAITPDGRYVTFQSAATNLIANDTNACNDIFVHDRQTGQTTRVSVSSSGAEGVGDSNYPSISADGRYVVFNSAATELDNTLLDFNNSHDIFLHDRQTGNTSLVSKAHSGNFPGNKPSYLAKISGDGHYVVFSSESTTLTGNSDTNDREDVFVRDIQAQTTSLVSATPSGSAGNHQSYSSAISHDGRYIAFDSEATDLVSNDTNNAYDIFVRDRNTNQTTRVSFDTNGNERISHSRFPSLSADGRYISYYNLNPDNQYDTFFTDRQSRLTTMVSVNNSGARGNLDSDNSAISADGKYVVFESYASNLVNNDITGYQDIFVRGPLQEFPWPMFLPAITGKK